MLTNAGNLFRQQQAASTIYRTCTMPDRRCHKLMVVVKARKRTPVMEGLCTVLKDELKVEKERYRTPDAVLEGPPTGYELEDRPQSNVLLLTRAYGDEEIYVEVDLDHQKQDDEDEEGMYEDEEDELNELPPVTFLVNVVKGDRVLGFSCETQGENIVITHVSLNDSGADDEEEFMPYTGPVFTELDDTLQQAFTDYLEERGITAEFGNYLIELVHDKLEVEYMSWLTRVQDFISS